VIIITAIVYKKNQITVVILTNNILNLLKIIKKHIALNLYNSLMIFFFGLKKAIKDIYMHSETTILQINYLLSHNCIKAELIIIQRQIIHQSGRVYLHNNSVSGFYSHKY